MRFALAGRTGIALVVSSLLVACGGKDTGPTTPEDPKTPVVRGETAGQPVTATIGAAGGTIALADGSVSIAVPAGAVSRSTNFTVTPIKNIAPNGVGTGVRLEPANLRFAVPLSVTFAYTNAPTDTLDELGQALAWQDSTGAWFAYINSSVTPPTARVVSPGVATRISTPKAAGAGGTVSAPVTRSGDLVRTYYWVPQPSTRDVIDVNAYEQKVLQVATCAREDPASSRLVAGSASFDGGGADLAPLPPSPTLPSACVLSTRVGTWDVFGIVGGTSASGTISTAPYLPVTSRAVYTAPDEPPINPVLVTGSLLWPARATSQPFTWKIRVIPPWIPLHVEVDFHNAYAQVVNSSFFTTGDVYDTVTFDINVYKQYDLNPAAPGSIRAGNHTSKIVTGGELVTISGLSFCAPAAVSGIFEWADMYNASTTGTGGPLGGSLNFNVRANRSIKGAKVFVGTATSCDVLEDLPAKTDEVLIQAEVMRAKLPKKPGESFVVEQPGGQVKWIFSYRP